jgi:hypothetical protein
LLLRCSAGTRSRSTPVHRPDGTVVDGAFLIQVSNNPYVLGATLDATERRRLIPGRWCRRGHRRDRQRRAKVVALSALGQRRRSRNWHEFTVDRLRCGPVGHALVGVDGEASSSPPR